MWNASRRGLLPADELVPSVKAMLSSRWLAGPRQVPATSPITMRAMMSRMPRPQAPLVWKAVHPTSSKAFFLRNPRSPDAPMPKRVGSGFFRTPLGLVPGRHPLRATSEIVETYGARCQAWPGLPSGFPQVPVEKHGLFGILGLVRNAIHPLWDVRGVMFLRLFFVSPFWRAVILMGGSCLQLFLRRRTGKGP
jgi:hypothetical protein